MLGRTISLLATYLIGRATHTDKEEAGFFSNLTMGTIKRVLLMGAVYALSLLVFIFGAVIVTADLILSTKEVGAITMTELSWVGLGVIVFAALIATVVSFMEFKGEKIAWKAPKKQAVNNMSPLAEALTVFASDFMRERRRKREFAEAERRGYSSRSKEEYSQNDPSMPHMN